MNESDKNGLFALLAGIVVGVFFANFWIGLQNSREEIMRDKEFVWTSKGRRLYIEHLAAPVDAVSKTVVPIKPE